MLQHLELYLQPTPSFKTCSRAKSRFSSSQKLKLFLLSPSDTSAKINKLLSNSLKLHSFTLFFFHLSDYVDPHILRTNFEHFVWHFGLFDQHRQPTGESSWKFLVARNKIFVVESNKTANLTLLSPYFPAPECSTLWWWVNKLVTFLLFCSPAVKQFETFLLSFFVSPWNFVLKF
jgi:hypothetical protein